MHTITIDCGASFIKGAYIKEGKLIKVLQKSAPKVSIDDDIFNSVQIDSLIPLVKEMILELAGDMTDIRLCISNEMHGFLLASEYGEPYTDYISWQKEFGALLIDGKNSVDYIKEVAEEEYMIRSGMPLRAGLPSCNLAYMKRKGYLEGDKKLYFYTLGDYIIRELSGCQPICHPTNAAATGLYDLTEGSWNYAYIESIGADDIVFPSIGKDAIKFELGQLKIEVLPALGDQQAALLGAGLMDENTLSFNLGTGAQVSKLISKPEYDKKYQIRPYFNGKYLKTIPHLPSGRAMNVYIRFIGDILDKFGIKKEEADIWETLLGTVDTCQESPLKFDMSFFENPVTERTTGCIDNIGEYSLTVANMIRGIITQMAMNFVWAAGIIEPSKESVEQLIFSGGVARRIECLRDAIMADYDNVTVKVAQDETLTGLYKYAEQF